MSQYHNYSMSDLEKYFVNFPGKKKLKLRDKCLRASLSGKACVKGQIQYCCLLV